MDDTRPAPPPKQAGSSREVPTHSTNPSRRHPRKATGQMAQPYAHTAHYVGHLLSNHPARRPSAAASDASPPAPGTGRPSTSGSSNSSMPPSTLSREALVEQLVDLIIMEEEDAAKDLMGVELGLEVRLRSHPPCCTSTAGAAAASPWFPPLSGAAPTYGPGRFLHPELTSSDRHSIKAGDSALDQYILSLMHKVRGTSAPIASPAAASHPQHPPLRLVSRLTHHLPRTPLRRYESSALFAYVASDAQATSRSTVVVVAFQDIAHLQAAHAAWLLRAAHLAIR